MVLGRCRSAHTPAVNALFPRLVPPALGCVLLFSEINGDDRSSPALGNACARTGRSARGPLATTAALIRSCPLQQG